MPTEHKRVRFDLTDHEMKPRYVDGKELPNWRDGPQMGDYIKQLWDEGWHLTGAASGRELIFERQVA